MKKLTRWSLALFFGAAVALAQMQTAAQPAQAVSLSNYLDSLGVDKLWLAGHSVDWRTGEAREKTGSTHCSAFVGAVSERLGITLLRPPEHGQALLANAQSDWLASQGERNGWHAVANGMDAQAEANLGHLVVAVVKNKNPKRPGHIAIVRPGSKTLQQIEVEGPDVIQAGRNNYVSASLKTGFSEHPGAFSSGAIKFFAHEIDSRRLVKSSSEKSP